MARSAGVLQIRRRDRDQVASGHLDRVIPWQWCRGRPPSPRSIACPEYFEQLCLYIGVALPRTWPDIDLAIGDWGSAAPECHALRGSRYKPPPFLNLRNGSAVYALLVGIEWRGTHAAGGHHQLLAMACTAGLGNVEVCDLRFGIPRGQDLVHAAVAVLTISNVRVACRRRFCVDAMIVSAC